jgi:hypothetical protein
MSAIALAAAGGLAALAALSRLRASRAGAGEGSLARRPSKVEGEEPTPEMMRAAEVMRSVLGLKDVLIDPKGGVFLIASAKHLESFLDQPDLDGGDLRPGQSRHLVERLLLRAGMSRSNARSYVDNLTHWDGLHDAVATFIHEALPSEQTGLEWRVTSIPEPGGPQVVSWSAKEGRLLAPKAVSPFRFCDQEPVPFGSPDHPVLLDLHERGIPPLFLSHGVSFDGLDAAVSCGGLLWPSMALTWRVPNNYGDVLFIADISTIARILSPSGSAAAMKHVYLAGTDIWSPTVRDLQGREEEIQAQLEGRSNRHLQSDLVFSSAKKAGCSSLVGSWSYFGADASSTDRIKSRSGLVSTMRRIMEAHADEEDLYKYPEERYRPYESAYRYPYAELKVVGKVLARDIPVCLYPSDAGRRVHPRLDRLGFQGFRVPFEWSLGPRKGWDASAADSNRWATAATQALLRWAEAPCSTRGVRAGEAVAPKEGAPEYRATLDYTSLFRFVRGRGVFQSEEDLTGRCGPKRPRRAAGRG